MYRMYITEALVCASKNSNTADKSYLLFTKEAGILWASARSVREERSKHRYALQDFGIVRVSLVRGKAGWRVTGSEAVSNLYFYAQNRETRTLVRNVVRLLRRLLHGEVPVPKVYQDATSLLTTGDADAAKLEAVFTIRALHELGYIGEENNFSDILKAPTLLQAYKKATEDIAEKSKKAIESALLASHL
jgi:recombinational DNA repair protein (RecF pathway)